MRAGAVRLILTGESGSGKTRICEVVAGGLRDRGWNVAGVVSPGVWEGEQRVAIDALDLRSGEMRRLAERADRGCKTTGPATRGWLFHGATLAWCNSLLSAAGDVDLMVIDELGPLELERGEGLTGGLQALDGGRFRVGLLVVRPHLLQAARARWPDARLLAVCDPTEVPARARELLELADPPQASEPPAREA